MHAETEPHSRISFTLTHEGFTLLVAPRGLLNAGTAALFAPAIILLSCKIYLIYLNLSSPHENINRSHFITNNLVFLLIVCALAILPFHFAFRQTILIAELRHLILTRKRPLFSTEKRWNRQDIKDVELASCTWQPKGASLERRRYAVRLLNADGNQIALILKGTFPDRKYILECLRKGLFSTER